MNDVYPPVVTISRDETSPEYHNAFSIAYSIPDQSGQYTMQLECKVDDGGWVSQKTISGSGPQTGTFLIDGLSSGTTYTISSRLSSPVGTTDGNTITLQTVGDNPSIPYTSFSNVTQFSGDMAFRSTGYNVDTGGTTILAGYVNDAPDYDHPLATVTTEEGTYSISCPTANTLVKFSVRSTNTQGMSSVKYAPFCSAPPNSTLSLNSATASSLTLDYGVEANGGGSQQRVTYEYYKGTSYRGSGLAATIPAGDGGAKSGTFTINNLDPESSYTIKINIDGQLARTNGQSITVSTLQATKIYGSVNGQSKKIEKLYGSVNGQTKEIKKLYGSVNGQTKLIYQA